MLGITVHSVKRLWDVTIRTREHTQTRHTCTQDPYMHNTKVCHVQSISTVRTHTHTPQSTLTCTIHKHVTYSQYNTHTHMAVALQSASEVPQLKGSKQRVQTNSNCFSFFLFFFWFTPPQTTAQAVQQRGLLRFTLQVRFTP